MIQVRHLGAQPYLLIWEKMKAFTAARKSDTMDELWLLEHPPVYTQGQAGKAEHVFDTKAIPLVQSDRGGQVTYHGPGQLLAYTLIDIQRRNLGIRSFVTALEEILIELLATYQIEGHRKTKAPGIYINNKKIASLGLRVQKGCTYHGLALNVAMDLNPFKHINPCGFAQMEMTQLQDHVKTVQFLEVQQRFTELFLAQFS